MKVSIDVVISKVLHFKSLLLFVMWDWMSRRKNLPISNLWACRQILSIPAKILQFSSFSSIFGSHRILFYSSCSWVSISCLIHLFPKDSLSCIQLSIRMIPSRMRPSPGNCAITIEIQCRLISWKSCRSSIFQSTRCSLNVVFACGFCMCPYEM